MKKTTKKNNTPSKECKSVDVMMTSMAKAMFVRAEKRQKMPKTIQNVSKF